MKNIPSIIYLQIGELTEPGDSFSELTGVTWCETNTFDTDLVYIRREEAKKKRKASEMKAYNSGKKVGYSNAVSKLKDLVMSKYKSTKPVTEEDILQLLKELENDNNT